MKDLYGGAAEFVARYLTERITDNRVLKEIIKRFATQQVKGFDKYSTLINLDDYSLIEWIEHAQQEMTDQLVYLECVKQKLMEGEKA